MSLNYDLTRVSDETKARDDYNTLADRFIWSTMATDMGEITAANEAEFYARVAIWEASANIDTEERTIPEQVHAFIGLRTNVATKPYAGWSARIMRNRRDEYTTAFRRWESEQS